MVVSRPQILDPALEPIREKVLAGERVSHDDGVALFRTRDIFTLGELANHVRERLHGRIAYYNVNRHINYSNYCVLRCKFCSFYRPYPKRGAGSGELGAGSREQGTASTQSGVAGWRSDGYEFSLDEILRMCREAVERGATEVHIVGGLHPKLPFEWYTDLCRAIREACPNLHIKAFTAIEIVHFARISRPRKSIEEVLIALRDAGLDSMPGGGAEIFDDRVHEEAYRAKVGQQRWFDVHRAAHDLGIPTNATMLYGHIETPEERVTHMLKLREHQDASLAAAGSRAAFNCFVPLSFIPEGSEFGHLPGPTGLDDLRTLAVGRLMLDNFPHVKAFWPMQSPKLAQV
jgi:aminodeoxyfutalosine synthase